MNVGKVESKKGHKVLLKTKFAEHGAVYFPERMYGITPSVAREKQDHLSAVHDREFNEVPARNLWLSCHFQNPRDFVTALR